jgi:hypothetical protein
MEEEEEDVDDDPPFTADTAIAKAIIVCPPFPPGHRFLLLEPKTNSNKLVAPCAGGLYLYKNDGNEQDSFEW